jgi:hypothetical protein
MQRDALKLKWVNLTDDAKIPYEKQARDHLEKQTLMKECITDALRKQKGGNCSRSHASLAKVYKLKSIGDRTWYNIISTLTQNCRQQATGAIAAPS